jgi:hypothetical protein
LLLQTARLTKRGTNEKRCHEILVAGGMESLLTLFEASFQSKELMTVSSLTVVYLLPMLLDADAPASSGVHMSVIRCLQFLMQASRDSTAIGIASDEIRTASAFAMTNLWFKVLVAKLEASDGRGRGFRHSAAQRVGTTGATARDAQDPFSGRRGSSRARGRRGPASQTAEHLDYSDVIDAFTSLSITAAESEASRQDEEASGRGDAGAPGPTHDMNVYYSFALIIESICTWEYAMPVAMKEGVLALLLKWLCSGDSDLERPAANALRNLTLTQDDYVAGWVHSQLLHARALPHIVGRLESADSRVRLALAEAILRLTLGPLTRAGIVEARGVKYLVQLLGSVDSQTRDEALALAAGHALLQLALGTAVCTREAQTSRRKESIIE